jgi:hypothetical protein
MTTIKMRTARPNPMKMSLQSSESDDARAYLPGLSKPPEYP